MASSADVKDIMGLSRDSGPTEITKEMILGTDKPKKLYPKKSDSGMKRPEGMARELYNLLFTFIQMIYLSIVTNFKTILNSVLPEKALV